MIYKQMRYFVSVIECNSFTEAAEQNYISQSAISQQIQSLEQDLGVKLIIRENRKFRLTCVGEYFYTHARELIKDVESLKKETIRIGRGEQNTLKIGYLSYYGWRELQQAIGEFSALYPEISISTMKGTHEELRGFLSENTADIILMEQRRAFSDEFVNLELKKCDCYVELSVGNSLKSQEVATVEDLKGIPCILISSRQQQYNEQEFYENILGFRGNFIFAESLEDGRLMTIGNRGFMPIELLGKYEEINPMIKRLPLFRNGEIIQRNYCAFWEKSKSNYYIEEFAKIMKNTLV